MSYPKWVSRGYGLGDILCLNEDEEAAVLNPQTAEGDADAPTVEELQAKLGDAGIEYDKRWGVKRLLKLLPDE